MDHIHHLVNYVKQCQSPHDSTEMICVDEYDEYQYKKLKQDGIMVIKNTLDQKLLPIDSDYFTSAGMVVLRRNFPREIAWLGYNSKLEFDTSSNPLYRRLIPPPCETVDHVRIILDVIRSTMTNSEQNYVEYGVRNGHSIEQIAPYVKVAYGVDADNYEPKLGNIVFNKCYTDEFSDNQLPNLTFHFAFIDADHSTRQVRLDFANIWKFIQPGGYIFLHDTYPCCEFLLEACFCNDCYKTPPWLKVNYPGIEILTLPLNPGLSIVRKPFFP